MVKTKIMNDKGEPIVLNALEAKMAEINQKKVNDLGFDIDITTMTGISKKISAQKFYEIPFADYLPVKVGENPYSSKILIYREFATGGDFEQGIINQASAKSSLAQMSAGVDSVQVPTRAWAKEIAWTHFELAEASRAGNWDVVSAKEKSRKKNWDLGLQRLAFLGLNGDSTMLGLFNQSGITTNDATRITQPISQMAPGDLKIFLAGILDDYRVNCSRTAWPTTFVIPESDYLGLAAPASAEFPMNVTLDLLQKMFQIMTMNPNFKVLPCKYADKGSTDAVSSTKQYYALYNADEESLVMNIPVNYQNTLANTVDGFRFQNVGFGQIGGVLAVRPSELLYFSFTP